MDKQEALNQAWYELRDFLNHNNKLRPIVMKLKAAIDMGEGLESEQFSETYKRLFDTEKEKPVLSDTPKETQEEYNRQQRICFDLDLKGSPFDFNNVLKEMQGLYIRKNHDYGNSFSETIQEFGFTPAIARINDKLKRVKQMVKGEQMQVNESMRDNLIDIANYCILTIIEIDKLS